MRVRLVLCACLVAFGVVAPAAVAGELPDFHSAGFGLKGTNGYEIGFGAFSERPDGRGEAHVVVYRDDRSAGAAFYATSAIVSDDFVKADFGPFGKVDLAVRPSGHPRKVHIRCSKQSYLFEPTAYEGIFEFEGEGGYTRASTTEARLPSDASYCSHGGGYGESRSSEERGARISGVSFDHGRKVTFQVNKNHPRGRVKYSADVRERRAGISIYRTLEGYAGAGAFRFAEDLSTASLQPPFPFAGSASLVRSRDSLLPRWRGDLTVDFVGRPDVRLAGPGVHASIVHACFQVSGDPSYATSC
jgi:hypothetical protein